MKKVLVTGASGFIGRHTLQPLIDNGFEVFALSKRLKVDIECEWYNIDLFSDHDSVYRLINKIRPTHLLHLAWNITPGKYWSGLDNFRWVTSSFELIKIFHESGGQRVVIGGSCAEYDWSYGYLSENTTPLVYTNPYSTSKNSLQHLVNSYAQSVGMSFAWGRIFWVYGPYENDQRLIPSLLKSLLFNEKFVCKNGEGLRDFLHVYDVADALVTILNNDFIHGPINIGSGQPTQIKDITNYVGEYFNRRNLIQYSSDINEVPFVVADISRLKIEGKWQPKIELKMGIEETINWWNTISREKYAKSLSRL